jgi:hypothetical protein
MKDEARSMKEAQGPRAKLSRLEKAIHSELGSLAAGAGPLLDEVRAGVAALYPEAGETRLAPKEQESRHEALLKSLDGLEEVVEALQLAARSGRSARGGG